MTTETFHFPENYQPHDSINLTPELSVKLDQPVGLSEYKIAFYKNGKRLSQARKEYKLIDRLEDCEVGCVVVEIDDIIYGFNFDHDGNEPSRCSVTARAKV